MRCLKLTITFLTLFFLFLFFKPLNYDDLRSNIKPVYDYSVAIKKIDQLKSRDTGEINPVCRSFALAHGQRVDRAIVLIHGYTSCPAQYKKLAEEFYDKGYNVLVPRLPHHGLKDRLNDELKTFSARDLIQTTNQAIDIAHGLGEKVVVLGLSASGVSNFWVAYQRPDLDLLVSTAPSFEDYSLTPFGKPFLNLLELFPNINIWWDFKTKASGKTGPLYAYPRFSTHGLAEIYRIGLGALEESKSVKPVVSSFILMINQNDERVNNNIPLKIVQNWQKNRAENVYVYRFEKKLGLIHDLISPEQVGQKINIAYPLIIEQVNKLL